MATDWIAAVEPTQPQGLKERVVAYERRLIMEALLQAGGNQRRAAAALGCLPTTLNEKMRRLGLRGRSQEDWPAPLAQVFSPSPVEALARDF